MDVQVDQIAVTRAGRDIVSNLSFTVAAGTALILRGQNGSGKTSLLRALVGLLPMRTGYVRVIADPSDAHSDGDLALADCTHLIGHANALKPDLSVRENLAFWTALYGESALKVDKALDTFNIGPLADIPAGLISAGQARRASLARLIAAPRNVWLLDEPTTSLDAASVALVEAALSDHLASGGLAIIATHLPLAIEPSDVLELTPPAGRASGGDDSIGNEDEVWI